MHDVPAVSALGHLHRGPGVCLLNKNTSNLFAVAPPSTNTTTNTEGCVISQVEKVAIYVAEETKVQRE